MNALVIIIAVVVLAVVIVAVVAARRRAERVRHERQSQVEEHRGRARVSNLEAQQQEAEPKSGRHERSASS